MATLRKAVLSAAIISTGLLSSTGMAFATGHGHDTDTKSHDDGHTSQHGVVNSKKVAPNTSPDVCNNQVPINILGVQIPLQDVAPSVSALDHQDDGGSSPSNTKTCSSPSAS